MRQIRYFDMFAGAGGFRSGLAKAGDLFLPVGWCEIDKYAQRAYRALYNTEGEYFCDDARKIDPALLPDIDLICGGFPCQSFSVAGKRGGFGDARGTLFFEIARIAAVKKPAVLLLENVPGLLNHDSGRTFAAILGTLSDLGYDVAWQVLNSKDFGVPQSRKRVYLVGYLGERCPGEVFSFTETNGTSPRQVVPGREGNRIYSPAGVSVTLASTAGGFAGRTGLYDVNPNPQYSFIDLNPPPTFTEECRCLTTRQDVGIGTHKGERSGVFVDDAPRAVMNPAKEKTRQNGRRYKKPNEPMYTLTVCDRHGIIRHGRVRKLTPRECFRLQGFTDEQYDRLVAEGISESQLYKLAGNSVTTDVVAAIGRKLADEWRDAQ